MSDNKVRPIPLSCLRPSERNMRKTAPYAGVPQLAADIASKGLLENLVVHKLDDEPDAFEVIAGGRRLAALNRLVKARKLPKDHPVSCLVVKDASDVALLEISLSENFQHMPPHPADQFQAFAVLKAQGLQPRDIAARFGITKAFVEQRLKLAAISPRLLAEYRKDRMTLEQVMAFTLTDDFALQEEVWFDQPYAEIDPGFIRRRLTRSQAEASDRRAVFIGAKAYEAAGGAILRDLFDKESEGYFSDSQLLDRLVSEKLETVAQAFRKDGWSWAEVAPQTDFAALAQFGHAPSSETALSKKEEKRLARLSARYDDLVARAEADEDPATIAELDAIEAELKALQARKEVWSDADKAHSGVLVSLDADGAVNIARGLIREHPQQADGKSRAKRERTGYPESVLRDLAAHRTAALREVLAGSPAIAHLALLEALVSMSFHGGRSGCLEISAREVSFDHHSDSVGESKAAKEFFARRQKWAAKIPEPDALWSWLQGLDRKAREELLALCLAMTVNALHGRGEEAGRLADLLGLDMRAWWSPTAAFLVRLSKADILAAVTQAVSAEAARRLSGRKKDAMAQEGATLLSDARWLPEAFCSNASQPLAAE